MSKAIDTLMNEHRLIESVLGSLRTFVHRLDPAQPEARARIAEYAEFFREFADRLHHGKEEDRLFPAMEQHGFPANAGPLLVMQQDHNVGRMHVRALASAGEGHQTLTEADVAEVRKHGEGLFAMLSAHIMKEDKILFPAAENAIPYARLESLDREFRDFDAEDMGAGAIERLQALAEKLTAEFPPDTAALEAVRGSMPRGH